jgi:integrase
MLARVDPGDTRLQPMRPRKEPGWVPPDEAGRLLDAVAPRHWALVLTPFLTGVRPEELLALRLHDIDVEHELILVHQRATPGAGDPTSPGFSCPDSRSVGGSCARSRRSADVGRYFPVSCILVVPARRSKRQARRTCSSSLAASFSMSRAAPEVHETSNSPHSRSGKDRSGRNAISTATSSSRRGARQDSPSRSTTHGTRSSLPSWPRGGALG